MRTLPSESFSATASTQRPVSFQWFPRSDRNAKTASGEAAITRSARIRIGSATSELRRALLHEGARALGEIGRRSELLLRLHLALERLLERRLRGAVDHALRERDGYRGRREQLLAQLVGGRIQLAWGGDPVGEPDLQRLFTAEEAAGHDQLLRA